MRFYHRVFLLWLDSQGQRVFLEDWNGFLSLPCVKLKPSVEPKIQIHGWLCERIRQDCGEETLVGDYAHYGRAEDGTVEAVLEILASPENHKLRGKWFELDKLESLRLSAPEHRELIQKRSAKGSFRLLASIPTRLEQIQERLGVSELPYDQMRAGSSSHLFRVLYNGENHWLKLFRADRPERLIGISQNFPELRRFVPEVVAFSAEEHWELMQDGGQVLNVYEAPHRVLAELFQEWALCQQASMEIEEGRRTGFLSMDQKYFESGVHRILKDPFFREKVGIEEFQNLQGQLQGVLETLPKLKACKLPQTIVHGDLHFSNVVHSEQGFRFLDLNSAGWGCPLLDLARFEIDALPVWPGLKRAYFQKWSEYMDETALDRFWLEILNVAILNQALHFYNGLAGIPKGRAMDYTVSFCRAMLRVSVRSKTFQLG